MRLTVDTDAKTLEVHDLKDRHNYALYSTEAFEILSKLWLKVGWNEKYPYTFSWMGRPIIQLPEDMIRMQEVLYTVRPTVVVETGIAHGGSLVYYAGLLQLFGGGKVIGIDIDIRPHNRTAIEAHPMSKYITLVEGDSTTASTISKVNNCISPGDRVLVILDSNHSREHVLGELNAYHSLVSQGSYIVATDGIMRDLSDVPRGNPGWTIDNPAVAAALFASAHPEFRLEQPSWLFNESELTQNVTHWPGAWLRRLEN